MEAIRLKTAVKPSKFENLGNGNYYYNYDINESIETNSINNEDVTVYDYIQVRIAGRPDYKSCVKAVIRAYITLDEEFDLINSNNSVTLKISDNSSAKSEYIEYLKLLATIKSRVKEDFKD